MKVTTARFVRIGDEILSQSFDVLCTVVKKEFVGQIVTLHYWAPDPLSPDDLPLSESYDPADPRFDPSHPDCPKVLIKEQFHSTHQLSVHRAERRVLV